MKQIAAVMFSDWNQNQALSFLMITDIVEILSRLQLKTAMSFQ